MFLETLLVNLQNLSEMEDILGLINELSTNYSVDPNLVKAICRKESNWISWRTRYEEAWKYFYFPLKYSQKLGITFKSESNLQATSFGFMQVMGAVARELGFDDYLTKLSLPDIGLLFGVKKLAQLHTTHDDIRDVISAYNAGTPTKLAGKYVNEDYVVDVMNNYSLYKANPNVY